MSRPSKYRHTDITDRLIRNAYASPEYATQRGRAVKSLAEKLGWPRYIIRRRALAIGAVQLHRKEPPWTDAELDLLEQHAHKVPDVIARIFRKHGYARTATAISVKTKRVGLLTRQSRIDAGQYSGRELSRCMGVEGHTIKRWIEKGWLKAERQGTERTERQNGDHWLIREKHIRQFLINHTAEINFGKIDKFWLIDILVGSTSGAKAFGEAG